MGDIALEICLIAQQICFWGLVYWHFRYKKSSDRMINEWFKWFKIYYLEAQEMVQKIEHLREENEKLRRQSGN